MKTMLAGLLLALLSGNSGAMTSRERCELIARLELDQCREQSEGSSRHCGNVYIGKLRHCERFYPDPVKKQRKKVRENEDGATPDVPTSIHSPAAAD